MNKEGWEIKKIKDIGIVVTGNTPKTSVTENYASNDICFIKPSDIASEKITILDSSENYISEFARTQSRVLPIGSVLVTCIGIIGKIAILKREAATNQQINSVIPYENINSKFLAYTLLSSKNQLNHIANAPVVPIINKTQFSNLSIPVPPLSIQEQIVKELDILNDIIAKKKEQLAELDTLAQAIFHDMFGDPVDNEKGWEEEGLGKLGTLERGKSKHRPRNASELLGGKYPLVQTGEVAISDLYIKEYSQTYSDFGLKQSKLWETGTLCITIAANIAKTSILSFEACFPDSVVGFIANEKTNVIFIHYWFSFFQKILEEQAPEVAQKNINLKILNELKVILPPLPLQDQFAEQIEAIEKQKELINQSIKEVQLLFNYTMDKYFN